MKLSSIFTAASYFKLFKYRQAVDRKGITYALSSFVMEGIKTI
ncbi:hypothetical protein [Flavobacterium degerlachei]|nr:hypothetical protein [Flavobacterium degerlachei]